MANHTITLTATEESIYTKYLALAVIDEATVMARLKSVLTDQVLQTINEKGAEKFKNSTVAEKLTYLG